MKEKTQLLKRKTIDLLANVDQAHVVIEASIITSYLINELGIVNNLSFLVDDDKMKIGKFSPHHAIQVFSFDSLKVRESRNAVILAWQHTNVLLRRLKENGLKGSVLVPLSYPRFLII